MKSCEKCGETFACGNSGNTRDSGACWCQSLPLAKNIPSSYQDCLCPQCLALYSNAPAELLPADFYTNEQGLMVFTEAYHLKRGYCCNSNCKHCPY